ncbi:hypothetical protein NWT09_29270 [Mycolicibacterium sp. jd]|uniref:hypothetical protein n=1 Tax=Mycolicibacterium TaxID=1866885 RepID=UPI001F213989|nr:hypothetical protein [Mycolicibacterium vanbaalenii]UJL30430.1 hypothetical protein HZU38_08250 [Mycolicibacterium vanbaalenii]WND56475.1 hypothetical protein QQA43_28090 [Mycolicibacterium vanbaalenii]
MEKIEFLPQFPTPVFHGTRVSLAQRILRDGFAPLPVPDQVAAVAVEHGVTAESIWEDLRGYNRFVVADPRERIVFVCPNKVRAGSWADRAPEAGWEALWAVYRLRHPHIGWEWNDSQEGHLWVLTQRLDDPPAVLEATAPLGALRDRRGSRTLADDWAETLASGDPDKVRRQQWLFHETREWLVAPGDLTPSGYRVVPARADKDLVRFLSGENPQVFEEQLEAGAFGEPGPSAGKGDRIWYPFDQVWSRLSPQRQQELEGLVEVPITSRLAAAPDGVH